MFGNMEISALLMSHLVSAGIKKIGMAPGNRNSTLNYVAQQNSEVEMFQHFDERSLAFYALGLAKQSRQAVAICCTSGTALANFQPAVLEAYYSRVPLVVISADRPVSLRGMGANQTMYQKEFFGRQVDRFLEIESDMPEKLLRDRANRFLSQPIEGPVHINFCVSEPMLPANPEKLIFPVVEPVKKIEPEHTNEQFFDLLRWQENLIMVIGSDSLTRTKCESIAAFASNNDIPVFCEVSNDFSSCMGGKGFLIDHPDFVCRNKESVLRAENFSVIRIGSPPVSRRVLNLEKNSQQLFIVDRKGMTRNPTLTDAIYSNDYSEAFFTSLEKMTVPTSTLFKTLAEENKQVKKEIKNLISEKNKNRDFTEWQIANSLYLNAPDESCLVLGNSMPIRDFSHANGAFAKSMAIISFRGLSGIDGLVSSVFGVADKFEGPTICLLGDLTFLYDINGLHFAAELGNKNISFVVNDNGGGDIFRYVGTKNYDEKAFVTKPKADIAKIVAGFDVPCEDVSSLNDFERALYSAVKTNGVNVIVNRINPDANRTLRERIW